MPIPVIHWVTRGKGDPRTSVVRDIPIRTYRQDEQVRAEIAAEMTAEIGAETTVESAEINSIG